MCRRSVGTGKSRTLDIVQGYPGFPAKYSGPNSLPSSGETREAISLDLIAGFRLWRGAEIHIEGMLWQGFGLNNALGVEGFPNGEGFRLGTEGPNGTITRLFIRQTIGLGGEQTTFNLFTAGVSAQLYDGGLIDGHWSFAWSISSNNFWNVFNSKAGITMEVNCPSPAFIHDAQ